MGEEGGDSGRRDEADPGDVEGGAGMTVELAQLRARLARSRAALGLIEPDKAGAPGRRAKRAKGKAARAARKRNRR
jgi:hypothetical protein